MANAKLKFETTIKQVTRQVVDVQEVKKVSGVTLTLSKHEARTLHTITRLIGGSPETSLRDVTDRIHASLEEAGVGFYVGNGRCSASLCMEDAEYIIFKNGTGAHNKLVNDHLPEPEEVRTGPAVVTDREPRTGDRIRIVSTASPSLFQVGDTGTILGFWGVLGEWTADNRGPGPALVRFDRTGRTHYCGSISKYEILA